jgi:hypothetical protein
MGDQGTAVVGAEHSQLVSEQLLECPHRPDRVASLTPPMGEAVASDQRVRVVGAKYP